MAPKCPHSVPKWSPKCPKAPFPPHNPPRQSLEEQKRLEGELMADVESAQWCMAPNVPKMTPEGPQMSPKGPQGVPMSPKGP